MVNKGWSFNLVGVVTGGSGLSTLVDILSQSFQFIFRSEVGDAYLGTVSRFMTNAFEYGDALLPQGEGRVTPESTKEVSANTEPTASPIALNQPYLNLAT